ncbi:MAG: amidohydrolase [Saprospiraceae bacterium]|nr:amidohydrolase [Saprospiraceae bacterium]
MSEFFTIDIHTHILPAEIPRWAQKFGYGGFIHLDHHRDCCARMMIDDRFFREIESNCWDPEVRIKDCKHHKVDVQVLSTIPVLFHYWAKASDAYDTSRFFNDHIASIVNTFPDRFVGLATLPLQSPDLSVKELERCMAMPGMAGIQIGSHVNDWNLNAPELWPVYEAAEKLGACIFVHPWDMMGKENMTQYWLPWLVGMPAETSRAICSMIFGGIFEKFPKLRVAFAHGGGAFPSSIGRIQHGFEVRPDLCAVDSAISPRDSLGKFYFDALVHDPEMLRFLVNLVGPEKIALGTDYPFPLGELQPGKLIRGTEYSYQIKQQMLADTAMDWLGLPSDYFKLYSSLKSKVNG